MQLKKHSQKNRFRPWLEHLENRLVPAFTGTINYDGTNLTVIGLDNQTTFTATVSAGPTVTLTDGSGSVGGPFTVTGNFTLNVATTQTAAFSGTLNLAGGNTLLGNVNLEFSRASTGTASMTNQIQGSGGILGKTTMTVTNGPAAGANTILNVATGSVVNLLGGLTINSDSTGANNINVNPAAGSNIGPMTVNTTGALGSLNQVLSLGGGGDTIFGLTANNLDTVNIGTGGTVTVNGNLNVTTRNNTVGGSAVTLGPTSTVTGTSGFGNVNVKFANNGTSGAHDVATFSGAIFGALSVNLGNGFNDLNANTATTFVNGIVSITGNNGTNAVNLSGGSFAGSAIVFTAGNGNNTLDLSNIAAGNAALTVSVGNGTNSVAFGTTASLSSATLLGGYGANTFTGTINFLLRTFRFS